MGQRCNEAGVVGAICRFACSRVSIPQQKEAHEPWANGQLDSRIAAKKWLGSSAKQAVRRAKDEKGAGWAGHRSWGGWREGRRVTAGKKGYRVVRQGSVLGVPGLGERRNPGKESDLVE